MNKSAEVEQLKKQEEIRTALKQTSGTKEFASKTGCKWAGQISVWHLHFDLAWVAGTLLFAGFGPLALQHAIYPFASALVSFGVLSLILGFALQTPITSLMGWIYLLVRQPYRFGDRIHCSRKAICVN